MASQNLPGVAAIRAAGYRLPISKIITLTGVATLLLAPFGAFALNLAAITAAICLGREAHADPDAALGGRGGVGVIYCVVGLFGAAVAGLLAAFPRELVDRASPAWRCSAPSAPAWPRRCSDDAAPRGRADHLPGHALGRRACSASARRSGASSPARPRSLCNSGGPADAEPRRQAMKLLFVADPLEAFKIYKDSTFAMMREAARARPRAARLRAAAT